MALNTVFNGMNLFNFFRRLQSQPFVSALHRKESNISNLFRVGVGVYSRSTAATIESKRNTEPRIPPRDRDYIYSLFRKSRHSAFEVPMSDRTTPPPRFTEEASLSNAETENQPATSPPPEFRPFEDKDFPRFGELPIPHINPALAHVFSRGTPN